MNIFKKMSLRMRITLFSATVTAAAVFLFTYMSTYSANMLFSDKAETIVGMSKITITVSEDENLQGEFVAEPVEVSWKEEGSGENIHVFSVTEGIQNGSGQIDVVPMEIVSAANGRLRSATFLFMGILIIAGTASMYFILGRALRPVGELSRKMREVDENSLFLRIENDNLSPEIKSITDSFNHMLERLEHAFQIQKTFAAAAAHELKTPLACISTNIDVLQMEELPTAEEYEKTIEVIKRNTDRLILLTQGLLDMNRSYTERVKVFLADVLRDIRRELRFLSNEKSIDIEICGDATVLSDFSAIYRIFFNLMENSIKYNREGGSVSIQIKKEKRQTVVCVQDTGIGIAENEIPLIFEPFYRVDKSRNRKIGGAGMGLSIVKELVEKSGGKIEASSVKGEGSCFRVFFQEEGEDAAE